MNKRIVRLTESDMNRLVRRIVREQEAQPQPQAQPQSASTQVQVSENMNYLLNYLDANGLIHVQKDKHSQGGNMVVVGNPKDMTNYLMEWIAKLTNNNVTDEIIAWCNKSQKWGKYKVTHVQITREYYPS